MAVSGARVAVATTAVALNSDVDSVAGTALVVRNTGAGAVDVGGASVTSGTGYRLAANESVTVNLSSGEVLYAVADTTATVHVLRAGA